MDREFPDFDNNPRNIRFGLSTDGINPFGEWGRESQYMACDPLYVQPSFLAMHEAEVHDDASAYPRSKTTGQ